MLGAVPVTLTSGQEVLGFVAGISDPVSIWPYRDHVDFRVVVVEAVGPWAKDDVIVLRLARSALPPARTAVGHMLLAAADDGPAVLDHGRQHARALEIAAGG